MAEQTDFGNVQSSYSDIIDRYIKNNNKIFNLLKAKKKAESEGNARLADEIQDLLDEAINSRKDNQKEIEILQTIADAKGEKINHTTSSQQKEQDELVKKLNSFWGRFGYNFSNNGGNIEKGSFGEGFGSTKRVKETGEALSMFGGKIGKVGGALTKFAGWIGIAIEAIKLLDKAIAAIADADAKQQDIQNRRNTMLTDRNIELSNIETEGNVDILNNFKDNMLSEYNKLFVELQKQVAVANAKAIASTNAQIEGTIGDINNAAWNALAAQTDIWAQQQKLGLQVAKTKEIENRAIAQRNIELRNRQSERGYQSGQSILKAQRTNAELNMEEQNYNFEHPFATTVNKMAGGRTNEDHVRGDNKWNERYNRDNDKYLSNGAWGSTVLGTANALTFNILKGTLGSGIKVQQTRTKRDLTNAQNDLNAAQAENANRNKVQNTVIANSNEIKNKVLEGMTDIQSSVIDTQATIKKAYQKMAQSVEKWMMDFQDKIYDSGIQKGMTTRGQLDKYRSAMLPIMEEVSRKYGITKEEFVKMQSDYTAEGRSKLLNREDIKQQSSLGKIYLGGDFGTAAELANNTEIFNMGVSDTVDLMGEMSKQVNKIGLDGRKYLKDMVKNLKMAQKYDFRNGVKGMMKMAKWAQNTRFNMDNLPNMIEDIQKGGLEGIITKAAKLQVLGGRFAMGADPIAMAFEAYNDPAALAKRFNSMTMGMGRFNKETGEVEFNGMEMDQMRALAENSGQSIDDIKKQARYNVKKDRVEGFINDKTLSQEQRMDLVNKAYYQDGQWKVNDVTGNAVNLSEVNSSNINNIQADTYEGKMEQGMEQIVSFTKLFTGNTEANMAHLSDSINKNGAADNELWERLKAEQEDFFTNSQKYADTILEKMQDATDAYKDFLNGFKDPADVEELVLTEIKGFREKTFAQLNSILRQMGGAAASIANKNELSEKLQGLKFGVNTRDGKGKNVSAQELVMNGSLYMGNNGQMYINQDKIRATYGSTGKLMYGDYTLKQLQQRGINNATKGRLRYTGVGGTTDYGISVQRQNEQRAKNNEKNTTTFTTTDGRGNIIYTTVRDRSKDKPMLEDGVMRGNGNSMFTQATNVTPINDGKVQIAKSDPKDTAVFAKTGGPFDTLFNDVFGRINDVYNEVHNETYSNTSSDVIPTEPLGKDAIFAEPPSISAQATNDGKVQIAKSDPKDTAVFAKTGGPFDTLFNDVFGRINDVYNEVHNETYSNTSSDVIPTESPSMFTQATNDGKVQIAKSDPKDTAVFAKTGGPFDTLFNDVFGRINDVYNEVHNETYSNTSSDVIPTESPSMFTQATNDGKVQIAKSDPKDTAVFAKTGGPFDTLFNDVFGRINDVYNEVHNETYSNTSSDVIPTESPSMFTQATNDGKVQIAKSDPKDTAVFAKTGGPFDTLFNDVFGRINDVYNEVHNETYSNTSSDVIPTESPSMFTQATNDGKVQIAKSDPKDTAVFAKTGGPFDTLFNDVFGRINDVYNEVHNETYSNTSSDVIPTESPSMFTQATNDGKVQIAKSDPKDTAVFAKTGGPFDTLFNDVFGRINDVYNEVHNETYSNTSSDVIPTESPSMFTQATNDGKVQIAKSDPKGTAAFAKTGGPFDTLFNDVFGRINDVYNEVHNETYSNTSSDVIPTESPSMFTQATNVTPINDGKVQIAKSDPKDTAVFAKTGGPFDTLFNDVYNEVHGNTSSEVIPTEPLGKDAIFAESPSISAQSTEFSSANDGKVQIDPVNIKIDGKLELTGSNGQTVDIISELNNNPMLLRAISDMIVQNISTKYYGGRPVGNSNFRK